MGEPVKIVVPGVPVPWARAGANTSRGVQFYTKPKARKYVERVKWRAVVAMEGRAVLTGAISMRIMVGLPIPKSWPKWKRQAAAVGDLYPTGKPDLDNFEKAALDALSGIVFTDDAQVTDKIATKRYAAEPSLILTVAAIDMARQARAA